MSLFATLLLAYIAVMLLIHVSTSRLLREWGGLHESWIKRRFPPQQALRVEALFWLLSLISWKLWPSFGWKAMVAVFAVIHLGIWAASELRVIPLNIGNASSSQTGRTHRIIIAFDLVEAGALLAMAWLTASYLLHPGQHLVAQYITRLGAGNRWLFGSFV